MSNRFLPAPLLLLAAAAGLAVTAAAAPRPARNLFHELLGQSDAAVQAKIDAAWQHFFHGDPRSERLYVTVGDDEAYLADVGSHDVRSEGMSYGMTIAVLTDHQPEFDRLWKWATTHMRHAAGPRRGYFSWHCQFDGTSLDPGSACDGEEWFATALLFAAERWKGHGGIFDYEAEAQQLLRAMIHQPETAETVAIFRPREKMVCFAPNPDAGRFTDPSYHLPAFYGYWARRAADPADREFWNEAASASREFFRRAANPQTGLMPEYANFDGTPYRGWSAGKEDFRFDAWRILANVAVDHAWFDADPWQVEQSNRVLKFLAAHEPVVPNQFTLEGKPLSAQSSSGLLAMAAVAGLAADPAIAKPWVQHLWEAAPPHGPWRYYDGVLYFLALLEVGGRFHPVTSP